MKVLWNQGLTLSWQFIYCPRMEDWSAAECMGSHLNTKSQCCQSLKQNSFSGVLFLKDRATGRWSACSEVPELKPAMGTHFCKHCSTYTDCFGKPQESFLCTTRNLPNDILCLLRRFYWLQNTSCPTVPRGCNCSWHSKSMKCVHETHFTAQPGRRQCWNSW